MDSQNTKMSVVVIVVVLAVASIAFVLGNVLYPFESPYDSGIMSITILGNSSDILYPDNLFLTIDVSEHQ